VNDVGEALVNLVHGRYDRGEIGRRSGEVESRVLEDLRGGAIRVSLRLLWFVVPLLTLSTVHN
jgi:hypothetical protein